MNPELSDKGTILAVDDKLENLKVLIKYLKDSGFELMVAQSGEETFSHLKRITPDIILLDVLMPGIDGFETCRRLKDDGATKDIPVIFMTALTETVDKVKGFQAGAVDYLTKPLQYEEVLARVNAHMTIRKFQQQLQKQNVLLQEKNAELEKQRLQLYESEARFRGLSQATFEGILIHDQGRIIDGNQAWEKMSDFQCAEMIEKNVLDFLTPAFHDMAKEWMRTKNEGPWEAEGVRKDGSLFPLELQAKTMPYQNRDVQVVAIRDLTWRKTMEEEKQRIQQENLTFSMDTLVFVTHELKSPLATMQSMIDVMMQGLAGDVPDKVGHFLCRIRRNCEELRDMVRNYLDFSRVGAGELVAHKASCDYYKEVVVPCVENSEVLFESRELTLAVDCPENITVHADHDLLRIALGNYLSNAAKYGAAQTQVRLAVRQEQGLISTTVSNEGAGFTPEEKELLFSRFSRLKNTNTANKRGSGLGLYLTKHIVELHGGKAWAESVPDQLTKFCFSFPVEDKDSGS